MIPQQIQIETVMYMSVFLDEYDYLIHLVRCAIRDRQPRELPETLSFETVYKHGVFHHVANIAFYSVKKLTVKPEAELYAQWEACCDRALIRDVNQSYARDEIVTEFEKLGIRWLEVQGTRIKTLYPQPEYRTMSDIDFIIDVDNLTKARDVLLSLGYQCKEIDGVEVNGFRPPNIHIELHTEYFSNEPEYRSAMRPPFASVDAQGEYDINEFFIYNMLHIAKHYFIGGCGIRRVLDAYYLNQNYGEIIDKEYVRSVLEQAKAAAFVQELEVLANQWFGEEEKPSERSEMASYIFQSGVHGTKANLFANRLQDRYGGTGRFSKLKYFWRRIIGTKKYMYATYPILRRWKILYPFCWLHRAVYVLRPSRRKALKKEVKSIINADRKQ